MNTTARHILLLALFWLLACGAAFAQQDSAMANEEFCGPAKQEIRCPKTSASTCVCYLKSKASQAEMQLKEVTRSVAIIKLPRPARRCLVLPQTEQLPIATLFAESVPTRPPRS